MEFCKQAELHFYSKHPEGTPPHALGHISHRNSAASISARKYCTFPPGKIPLGAATYEAGFACVNIDVKMEFCEMQNSI